MKNQERNHLIYKHTSPSGKAYIGQTKNYEIRCQHHRTRANKSCPSFYKAITKYGWENFTHEILIDGLTHAEANELESFYIKEHGTLSPNGYNLNTGGDNPVMSDETIEKMRQKQTGRKHPEEIKEKIRNAHIGKKLSKETIEKIKKTKTGVKMPEEFREKMRIAQTGRKLPEEVKEKIRQANKGHNGRVGYKHSEETKAKMSYAAMGRKRSPESIEKTRQGNIGRKQTPEQIEKKRHKMTGRKYSAETKAKMSESRRNLPPEVIKKITEASVSASRGRKHTDENKEKMREGHRRRRELLLDNSDQ